MCSIPIYPNGDRYSDDYIKITFKSKDEKDIYIKEENKFCSTSINMFHDALKNKKRDQERKVLDLNRVRFAIKQGFKQYRHNNKIWTRGGI